MSDAPTNRNDFAKSLGRVLELGEQEFSILLNELGKIVEKADPREHLDDLELSQVALSRTDIAAAIAVATDFYSSGFSPEQVEEKAGGLIKHLNLRENKLISDLSQAKLRVQKLIEVFAPAEKIADIRKVLFGHEREYQSSDVSVALLPVTTFSGDKKEIHTMVVKCNLQLEFFFNGNSRSVNFGLNLDDINDLLATLEYAKMQVMESDEWGAKLGLKIVKSTDDL